MTGNPIVTLALSRDKQAEAIVTGGLAAYNAERLRPADTATLDLRVGDEGSGAPLGGLRTAPSRLD